MPEEKEQTPLVAAEQSLEAAIANLTKALGEIDVKAAVFPDSVMKAIIALVDQARTLFKPYNHPLTPTDRRRLVGTGYKTFGFIEQAYASAVANPSLVPAYLNMQKFKNDVEEFGRKRNLEEILKEFGMQVGDSMFVASDSAYHDAVEYYNAVKEAARQRVPDAEAVYLALKDFFKHAKHQPNESTETDND